MCVCVCVRVRACVRACVRMGGTDGKKTPKVDQHRFKINEWCCKILQDKLLASTRDECF